MLLTAIVVVACVAGIGLLVLFTWRRSQAQAHLQALQGDLERVRKMVLKNADAFAAWCLAEHAANQAKTHFGRRDYKAAEQAITQAYVHLQAARRVVQPDPPEDDEDS